MTKQPESRLAFDPNAESEYVWKIESLKVGDSVLSEDSPMTFAEYQEVVSDALLFSDDIAPLFAMLIQAVSCTSGENSAVWEEDIEQQVGLCLLNLTEICIKLNLKLDEVAALNVAYIRRNSLGGTYVRPRLVSILD
jgi:hypothetical protein